MCKLQTQYIDMVITFTQHSENLAVTKYSVKEQNC